jgi:WD40 repeat protein
MKEQDVRKALLSIAMPDELDAQRRAWQVVQAAFAERERVPWPRQHARPIVAFAVLLALLAAALSPPGRAFVREVREVVGIEEADQALFSLPDDGRLLVVSDAGAWVVHPDGSRRLLGPYREASWSPRGRYVVATGPNLLAALEPDGERRWSLARPAVRRPRWGGNQVDTRIAYLSGASLRVVAGDGRGDRLIAQRAGNAAPAWKPFRGRHVLAYAEPNGRVRVVDVDSGRRLWRSDPWRDAPTLLQWSPDGSRLLVVAPRSVRIFDHLGGVLKTFGTAGRPVTAASFAPKGKRFAVVRSLAGGRSEIAILSTRVLSFNGRRLFTQSGRLLGVQWSPDGRWLVVPWKEPDQWVFLPTTRRGGIRAVDNVTEQFGGNQVLAGWCCP